MMIVQMDKYFKIYKDSLFMTKVAVVAVGGNSLIKDNKRQSVPDQYKAVEETCVHIADMVSEGYNVVITHGNGPQVGFILLRSEVTNKVLGKKAPACCNDPSCELRKISESSSGLHTVPLDSCGADTQGAIGYQIQQALSNEFLKRGIKKQAATVVTQVLVDANDPSFKKPSKPIGGFYTKEEAEKKRAEEGWEMVEDAGRGYRRVVASPMPLEIIEEEAIKTLIKNDFLVVAVGGGGIPVVKSADGKLSGTAAVIDKDFASSLLASNIKADVFIISTAVEKVALNFGTPEQKNLDTITLAEAKKYMQEGHFKAGSMLPKIKAAITFLEKGGQKAIITQPESIIKALKGQTGTHIIHG